MIFESVKSVLRYYINCQYFNHQGDLLGTLFNHTADFRS